MSEIKPTIGERLSDLLSSGKFSDTEFIFQNGDKVKGHKLIFAIASPVFEAMMYGDLAENGSEIKVDDIDPEGFKTMTKYIYSDNLELNSVGHAISVYKAADKYDLPHLKKKTFEFVDSNIQTEYALEVIEFSKLYSLPSTEEKCIELLQENTEAVISSDYASKCSIDTLQTIVDEEKLKIPEVELFKFVEKWAKCYAESNDVPVDTCKPVLESIISKIRFLAMSVTDFLSFPFKSQLLTVEEKHNLLLNLNESNSVALLKKFCNSTTYRDPDKKFSYSFTIMPLYCNEYSVQWRLKNLPEMKLEERYCSPTFYVGDNQPFKICFYPRILEEEKYLSLFMLYSWIERLLDLKGSCDVQFSFKLTVKGRQPIKRKGEIRTFKEPESSWGWSTFCKWSDISHENGKDIDYGILIEANVKLFKVVKTC